MKKTIAAISVLGALLVFNFASARPQILPLAIQEPVDFTIQQIWEAVNTLQDQINNIQLIPGPQGEPGEDGIDGVSAYIPPEALRPRIDGNPGPQVCFNPGNRMTFKWVLLNDYGHIPETSYYDNYYEFRNTTGISWGTTTVDFLDIPHTWSTTSNGFHQEITFDAVQPTPPINSLIEFEGKIFWNGFVVPIHIGKTWPSDQPAGCYNAYFLTTK